MNKTLSKNQNFEFIWEKIKNYSGQDFYTITGLQLTYVIKQNQLLPSRTKYKIPKSDFEKAYLLKNLDNTTKIKELRGASYIFAILNDRRIIGEDCDLGN